MRRAQFPNGRRTLRDGVGTSAGGRTERLHQGDLARHRCAGGDHGGGVVVYRTAQPQRLHGARQHILVTFDAADPADRARALDLISDLRERILKGERFETLARRYSDDPVSRARGGDLNYYPKGTFAPEFEEYVWNAPIGQLSDVVETSFGFHLIVATDRHLTDADRYEMELDQRARDALRQRTGAEETAAP